MNHKGSDSLGIPSHLSRASSFSMLVQTEQILSMDMNETVGALC